MAWEKMSNMKMKVGICDVVQMCGQEVEIYQDL
jgi:hypothetical protein